MSKTIKGIIKEEIEKFLIKEFYYADRKRAVNNCMSMFDQIMQNWCLISYTKGMQVLTRNHWKRELSTNLKACFSSQVQCSPKVALRYRESVIDEAFTKKLKTIDKSIAKLEKKFSEEKFPTNNEAFTNVVNDFLKNALPAIKEVLINYNDNGISTFCDSLI